MIKFHSIEDSAGSDAVFSILIPSWNNLEYLKLCVRSIRENSAHKHQIILHLNDGSDGSQAWAEAEGLDYSISEENVGVCFALNAAATLAKTDYIAFMNDDMYACPNWDKPLVEEIKKIGHAAFFLSATMIEPTDTGNACVLAPHDFGRTTDEFREQELLENYLKPSKPDWSGATWPPNVVHRDYWQMVGGYSIEFSPGMSSDPDFSMKLWQAGVRYFKGLGQSRVYHFQAKSTHKIVKNNGNSQFLRKWNMTQSTFHNFYIKRGENWSGPQTEPKLTGELKRALSKSKWKLRLGK